MIRILHLEDSDLDAELVEAALDGLQRPFTVTRVISRGDFTAEVHADQYDIILADYVLPMFDGLGALAVARVECPETPFVFVSGTLGEDVAVEAMKNGAVDYVTKQRLDRLPRTVLRALAEARVNADKRIAETALQALLATLETRIAERTRELETANRELLRQIGERERVEEALRMAQRLEAIGQLTSGVAHDFNNLLTVIIGNLEFLGRSLADDKSKRRLCMMKAAADRGANLTSQLLAFSRRQRLQPTALSLNETVESMHDLLQSAIGGTMRIETELRADLWPALIDPTQIELLILNLAINARDATSVGGRLTIRTDNVTLVDPQTRPEHPSPGDYVMISLRDTGSGMTPEVLARAFEPFFTTKEVGKGSGLGLAQAFGFVKQSGGGMRVETAVGQGTAIEVFLPRASTRDDAAPEPACAMSLSQGASRRSPTVLVVDDDAAVREITATRLSEAGHRIREADSGPAALSAMETDPEVDLVVLDFAMPGMNGAEVATVIRRQWPRVPVLFVTGYADTSALIEAGAVSATDIVQKPFRAGDLEQRVAAVINVADASPL